MAATFYGVGVGPGDPELLTLKALKVLRSVPVVAYPACKVGAASYASRIVEGVLEGRPALKGLLFPMEKGSDVLLPVWRESVAAILEDLSAGREVAFITEGDPFFYSTFIHLYRIFREEHPEIRIEIVPGVSSVTAAAAAALLPLASGDERVAFLPATYEDEFLARALDDFDVVVFLKVSSVLPRIIGLLEGRGLLDRAVLVERVGSREERIVRDLASLRGKRVNYLSLVQVRKDAR